LTRLLGTRILCKTGTGWRMGTDDNLPPLDELAALQEAMAGLAQMGAVLQSLRRTSWGNREAEEEPADERDS
jgi:hypothetical protein